MFSIFNSASSKGKWQKALILNKIKCSHTVWKFYFCEKTWKICFFQTFCDTLWEITKEESIHFFADQEVKKNEKVIFSKNPLKTSEKNTDFPVFFMILLVLETYTRAETVFTKKTFCDLRRSTPLLFMFFAKKITFLEKSCFFLLLLAFTKEGSVSKLLKSMISGHFSQKSWLIWLAQLIPFSPGNRFGVLETFHIVATIWWSHYQNFQKI